MSKYLVTLTPTGKFFFGGDMRFSINGNKEEFSSYIIESSKMPQQTSLLGMMRFLLLSNSEYFNTETNSIKDSAKKEVASLIGENSFTVTDGTTYGQFGKIASVGPCFILEKESSTRYFRAPADYNFTTVEWIQENITEVCINGKKVRLPKLKLKIKNENDKEEEVLFTGKNYLTPYFTAPFSNNSKAIEEKDLFIADKRIGIDKDYEGKSKTNALYKQVSYRMETGYCFAFEAEVDDNITIFNKQLVSLGADSSTFIFEAKKIEEIEATETNNQQGTTVVLLSDAYIPAIPDDAAYSFSINKMRTFRFLKTSNSTDASYYRINGKTTATTSERYELYEAGSTFYFDNTEKRDAFCKILEERKDFNQIGYNKYYIK